MRTEPSWRLPAGVLGIVIGLIVYSLIVARYVPGIVGEWHALAQTAVYLFLGLIWLLPLGRLLQWMETGRWRK